MRILFLGEYSNVHATLAEGLRAIGHHVTVASNGDFWKDYPRDIDLRRPDGRWGGLRLMMRLYRILPQWRGYDIVQIINPLFVDLKAERVFPVLRYLLRHNRRVVMGAFGMDTYWVRACVDRKVLRYSDFNIGETLRQNPEALCERADWIGTAKQRLNQFAAQECAGIVAGLYEYWVSYQPYFPGKTTFIPFPIHMPELRAISDEVHLPIRCFVGISKNRSAYKGTDIMLRAAQDLEKAYPDKFKVETANGVPFAQYQHMMDGCHLILDQLYSYTPAMNALLAMSKGIICVGGGEPENYDIIGEQELRPIINVTPTYESVYSALEQLVLHPERIPGLQRDSIAYVRKHHDHISVARRYEAFYIKVLSGEKPRCQ